MGEYQVTRVGSAAAEVLSTSGGGSVIGVTSKGAFLRSGERIVFLTEADYRSPFNLTLSSSNPFAGTLQVGESFTFAAGVLHFPGRESSIDTTKAEVWEPAAPVSIVTDIVEQLAFVDRLARRLRLLAGEKGYLFLSQPAGKDVAEQAAAVRNAADGMVESFRIPNKSRFTAFAADLLGNGGGLTPSGDDFITGFFLYHFRRDLATGRNRKFLREWCAELTQLAYQKTTTISANRLMVSALGWTEDLFLHLINSIFDPGVQFTTEDVRLLLEFGHSSGVDTFMGIRYAIQSMTQLE